MRYFCATVYYHIWLDLKRCIALQVFLLDLRALTFPIMRATRRTSLLISFFSYPNSGSCYRLY